MKLIIINKNRLGIIIIIVGLMLILLGFYKNFDASMKHIVLIQNNINSLSVYKDSDEKFTYKLPSGWVTKRQNFEGAEIRYHNDFWSEDAKIHGFIEIWNINEDLESFLQKSKDAALKQNEYQEYSINPAYINGKTGYEVASTMSIPQKNIIYKGYEYFIRIKNGFIRFSFFVKDKNYKENMPVIFKTIVDTVQYTE